VDFDEFRFARSPHDPVIERTSKKFRKNCDEVKPHRCRQFSLIST
jgi:hypothetical protein